MPAEDVNETIRDLPATGLQRGLLCCSSDVRAILKMSWETWNIWKAAGLKTIGGVGTASELVFTDEVFRFLASNPKVGSRKKSSSLKRAS